MTTTTPGPRPTRSGWRYRTVERPPSERARRSRNQAEASNRVGGGALIDSRAALLYALWIFRAVYLYSRINGSSGRCCSYIRTPGGKVPSIYGPSGDDLGK